MLLARKINKRVKVSRIKTILIKNSENQNISNELWVCNGERSHVFFFHSDFNSVTTNKTVIFKYFHCMVNEEKTHNRLLCSMRDKNFGRTRKDIYVQSSITNNLNFFFHFGPIEKEQTNVNLSKYFQTYKRFFTWFQTVVRTVHVSFYGFAFFFEKKLVLKRHDVKPEQINRNCTLYNTVVNPLSLCAIMIYCVENGPNRRRRKCELGWISIIFSITNETICLNRDVMSCRE